MSMAGKSPASIEDDEATFDGGVEVEREDAHFIQKPFDPERIKVKTTGRTIDLIVRRIDHGEVDLAPEFQRRARVWDAGRKSRLIESLLLRIPLPVFYVAADSSENWAVVDGLQRLTTIHDFVKDGFRLSGLEYLMSLDHLRFSDLPRAMQRRIEETELVIHVIEQGTPEEVMINIFKRINTGGVSLKAQEIRNALYKGPARAFLRNLASSEEFTLATASSVSDKRMDAQECVLRWLAFNVGPWESYESNDLDGFLSMSMRRLNEIDDAQRDALAIEFARAMSAAHEVFGDYAFRKRESRDGRRNPVSKALFEAWGVNLARRSDDELAALVDRKESVTDAFIQLMTEDRDFDVAISYSTGDPRRVAKRFGAIKELIDRVLLEGHEN